MRPTPRAPDAAMAAAAAVASGRPHRGEELGTDAAPLGDDAKKGGENIWISRIGIDLGSRERTCLQFGDKCPPNLKRAPKGGSEGSPKGSRKVEPGEAERTLQSGIEGRERAPQGERDRSGQENPTEDGPWCVTVASLESPGPARAGFVRHDPCRRQRPIADVAPRSTGGFGRTVTRGCVASGPAFRFLFPTWVDLSAGRPRARRGAHRPPPGGSARPGPGRGHRGASPRCSGPAPAAR